MIQVRSFTTSDKSALAKIYLACRLSTFSWIPGSQFSIDDFTKDTEGETILVATYESVPIGFVSLWIPDNFVHHLYLLPNMQRMGIGRKLLHEALMHISRPARLKCVVQNAAACRFYEKNGWRIESTTNEGPMGPYNTYILEEPR